MISVPEAGLLPRGALPVIEVKPSTGSWEALGIGRTGVVMIGHLPMPGDRILAVAPLPEPGDLGPRVGHRGDPLDRGQIPQAEPGEVG